MYLLLGIQLQKNLQKSSELSFEPWNKVYIVALGPHKDHGILLTAFPNSAIESSVFSWSSKCDLFRNIVINCGFIPAINLVLKCIFAVRM